MFEYLCSSAYISYNQIDVRMFCHVKTKKYYWVVGNQGRLEGHQDDISGDQGCLNVI